MKKFIELGVTFSNIPRENQTTSPQIMLHRAAAGLKLHNAVGKTFYIDKPEVMTFESSPNQFGLQLHFILPERGKTPSATDTLANTFGSSNVRLLAGDVLRKDKSRLFRYHFTVAGHADNNAINMASEELQNQGAEHGQAVASMILSGCEWKPL